MTKTIWYVVDLEESDDDISTLQESVEDVVQTYIADGEELFDEIGLTSIKKIHHDSIITDENAVREKIKSLAHNQWELGWSLVNDTISKAGGLYRENTWTPSQKPLHSSINWWDVRIGATILDGYPTMRSIFVVGFSPSDWTVVLEPDMQQRKIALVRISFRI